MTLVIGGICGICLLFLLMGLSVPIGFAMALVGISGIGLLVSTQAAFFQAASIPFELVSDYAFSVLPLFILMAQLIFESGFSKDMYQVGYKWLGRVPGGLALATIVSCAVFAAVCASSVASAITMGLVALPEMKKYNYDVGLSCATVVAGGTLGILIPPSGILIVYGILTEQSIGKLFIAGIVPGILLAILFMIYIYIRARLNPSLAPTGPSASLGEKFSVLAKTAEMIILIALILTGLIAGWFTPTEAGAVGAFGALIMATARRRMTWKKFLGAVYSTMRNTGMIFIIITGAMIFNVFLAITKIPILLATAIGGSVLPPTVILSFMIIIYLVLGCFIDAYAMVMLTIPIFYPVAIALGYDPIFFGILIVLVVEMAMITPPVGMNVFAISGITEGVPLQVIFRGALPFVGVMIFFIIMIIAFPNIVLFLPDYFGM